jgi:putative ABC transport system permease protein
MLQTVGGEIQYLARRLTRAPMFTALTVLTLAVGIGANIAIFSVIRGVLLKPLPYPNPENLVAIWEKAPGLNIDRLEASPATYFTFREENKSFEDIAIYQPGSVTITGLSEPEEIPAMRVSVAALPLLGVQPFRGRWFSSADDQPNAPLTAVLTYGYWQQRFGGDPGAIGKTLLVDSRSAQIIGVMPSSFRFLDFRDDIILPLQLNRSKVFVGDFSYRSFARLKPGVTVAQANVDVARLLPLLPRKFPLAPGMDMKMIESARLRPNVRPLKNDVVNDVGSILWVLMGTVGIVLLIACANVANLMLARAEGRQQEFAIRSALGASAWRLARQLLSESIALALAGGALGMGVAYGAIRFLVYLAPSQLPRLDEISIDPQVGLFALAISLASGVLFGLAPIFKYASARLATALREGGRTLSEGKDRHGARNILVVVQVALALVLLISSGLMIRTFQALRNVQPGFLNPGQLLTFRISIPEAEVASDVRVAEMHKEILSKIALLPGVSSTALTNSITMDGYTDNDPIFAEDHPEAGGKIPKMRRQKFLSPHYFRTMGNPLVAGRDFSWTDVLERRPVVIVSENLAKELWGSPVSALGKRLTENPKGTLREVIGVVGTEYDDGVNAKPSSIVYWPYYLKNFWSQPSVVQRGPAYVVRCSRAGTSAFLNEVRQAVWSVNRNLPISNVQTEQEVYDHSLARTSFTLLMLAIAAGMAMLLGLVGIYGVISYSVAQRTREIGIRMALGAPHQVVRLMFVRQGLILTAIGVACGVAASIGVTRVIAGLLFNVSPIDPITFGGVSVLLLVAALLASYIPARRATTVDPVEALRIS